MREIVERLALALDNDDYDTAHSTLADDVQYDVKGMTLVGPEAVVDSYRAASLQAHELFDAVGYDHEISSEADGEFVIEYTDILTIGEETLVHHARQNLSVDPNLGVTRIVNVEIPGEADNVDRFLARHGKSR